jgi:diacylglycerol kinase (ATP)
VPQSVLPAVPAKPRRVLLLVNPNARRGGEALDPVIAQMEQAGLQIIRETFEKPAEVSEDILRRKDSVDCVVVCGGDGTVNSAAPALMKTGLPFGIFPMGTANDLARTLGIPNDLHQAAGIIIAGKTHAIDVGTVNGHPFFNVASLGLSADLANALTTETKQRWGRLGYALAAARVLLNASPFSAEIMSKGTRRRVKTYQIAVGNGRHYGGGNVVETDAAIDDGQLDLYSLEIGSVWKLALMARKFRHGAHGAMKEVRTERCNEIEIRTRKIRQINTDGELVTHTPALFKVHPKAVNVYIPD